MSRRKDLDRFLRFKRDNQNYKGFRGESTVTESKPQPLESVLCSVCGRKRNVPRDAIPEEQSRFVCMTCHDNASAEWG